MIGKSSAQAHRLCVYHVTGGGYLQTEYRSRHDPNSELAGALTHEFYGAPDSPRALLLMKFEGRWRIYYQGQTGAPDMA